MAIADIVAKPKRIPRGFAPPPAGDLPLTRIDRDDGSAAGSAGAAAFSSGLEGTNYIIIELGDAPDGGSTADEILFRVGPSFVIHLLGGSQYFVPGAALQYGLPGSNPSAYKHVKADGWDTLRLQFKSQDAIQIARVVLVKSYETVLDARVDDWLDKYSKSIVDLSIQTAERKWDGVGRSRVTALFYASQDLGQTGSRKYVSKHVKWCSEFASHMIRQNGLPTPKGDISTKDMKKFFKKHDRLFTRADVDANKYTVRPGDYMSINDGGHSVLFRERIGGSPAPGKIDPEKRFATIEGNVGNMVRLQTRKWKAVEAVGCAQ